MACVRIWQIRVNKEKPDPNKTIFIIEIFQTICPPAQFSSLSTLSFAYHERCECLRFNKKCANKFASHWKPSAQIENFKMKASNPEIAFNKKISQQSVVSS